MAVSPTGFPATQDPDTILVENISAGANRLDILALFDTRIGKIRKSEGVNDPYGSPLKISFFTSDASQKALCMSGYVIGGRPLVVTMAGVHRTRQICHRNKHAESRRNLYVLGLPFTLTKSEFTTLFSRFGTVCHCVILATLDNASRRRGFIVMSSHAEAKLAMGSLSRTQLKGHVLDISWAVVQRSQGFLDGGDRHLIFEPPAQVSTVDVARDEVQSFNAVAPDIAAVSSPVTSTRKPLTLSQAPTSTLLVMNLPAFLFSHSTDLHPLLLPFGKIQRLEIIAAPIGQDADDIHAIVEYLSPACAAEAKETLQGQYYSSHAVVVEFIASESSSLQMQGAPVLNVNASNLNPFAPTFVSESSSSQIPLAKPAWSESGARAEYVFTPWIGSHEASMCGPPGEHYMEHTTVNSHSGPLQNVMHASYQRQRVPNSSNAVNGSSLAIRYP